MSRVFSSRLHNIKDDSADAVVAALARRIGSFFMFPIILVLAMRPQEREAAKIAQEFDTGASGRSERRLSGSRLAQSLCGETHSKVSKTMFR